MDRGVFDNQLDYPFDSEFILKKKRSIKKALLQADQVFVSKKIAILGGSTTNDIKLILELFLLNYGIKPEFYESEYNQYYEDVMFENKTLKEFAPDIIYIHTSNRNIMQYPALQESEAVIEEKLISEYKHFEQMWNKIFENWNCIIIQNNFEYPSYRILGNREASDVHGKINYITRLNMKFYEYAQLHDHFYINDINYISSCYGLDKWSDPFYWHMYKYALSVSAIPELAFNVARIIKSLFGKNKKVLALDLDNTLWGGVVGDDGIEGIEIGQETSVGQAYLEFQKYLKEQKQAGVLLTVNSKNDMDNALAGLNHPDAVLHPDDFITIKANWDEKDKNIVKIAEELNVLPEGIVFVDDNPAERALVKRLVGVAVPEMERAEHYIKVLDKAGFFEITNFSGDDMKRNEMYLQNFKRKEQEKAFDNYEDYLISLDMRAVIREFEPVYMSRIAQLTNKSNQFNLTTKRFTQAEIEEISKDQNKIDLYGKLEDKFGDNGVVSVIIGSIENEICNIDLWIMSCRVLKRNMEFAMLDALINACKARSLSTIRGFYYPTKKNNMVRNHYEAMGFTKLSEDSEQNTIWEYQISEQYVEHNQVIKVEFQ